MRNLICLLLIISSNVYANDEMLIMQFFGKDGISNKQSVYTGEMLTYYLDKPTLGESLPEGVDIQYRLLKRTSRNEIFAVLLSKDGKSQDWYIYFTQDHNIWKISAVRNLALPGVFYMALQELDNKSDRTLEEEYQYQNILLTIKPDSFLRNYLKENLAAFDKIIELAKSDQSATNKLAKKLNLNFVKVFEESGIIDVNIGGTLDNSVGYIFVPEGSKIPIMSPDNYIYIEQVVGRWFIYKTT